MFKNMAFFILTLFTLLYWRLEFYSHVVISCMTGSFHWEGKLGTINSVYLHHIFLKCLYQVREVSCHVYVCKLSCICVYHFRLDFGSFPTVLNCLDFNLYSSFKSGTFVFSKVSWQVHTTVNIPLTYFVNAPGLKNVKWLETDHLTCRGGICYFVLFRIIFSDNTRVRIYIFFVAQSAKCFSRY
jgi:hypothetical protein